MLKKARMLLLDKGLPSAGTFLTLLCAVHCMAVPLFLLSGSVFAVSFLTNPWVELMLLPPAFALVGYTLYKHYRHHRRRLPIHLFILGAVLGTIGLIFHIHFFIGASAVLILIAQYFNHKLHKLTCAH